MKTMTDRMKIGVMLVGSLTMAFGAFVATAETTGQDEQGTESRMQKAQKPMDLVSIEDAQPLCRASQLLDMQVKSSKGATIGKVADVVLSQDRATVEYVAISLENAAGGKKYAAVGLDKFLTTPDSKALYVKTSADELTSKHGFSAGEWPSKFRAGRLVQSMSGERSTPREAGQSKNEEAMQEASQRGKAQLASRRASELIGMQVQNTAGDEIAKICDLLIDTENGNVKNATLETGGILGIGAKFASVDWKSVQMAPNRDFATVAMTEDQLKQFAYSKQEYWQRLGFTGEEENMQEQGNPNQDSSRSRTTDY